MFKGLLCLVLGSVNGGIGLMNDRFVKMKGDTYENDDRHNCHQQNQDEHHHDHETTDDGDDDDDDDDDSDDEGECVWFMFTKRYAQPMVVSSL